MTLVLLANASAQVFAASLLGWWMLVPMQPWGRAFARLVAPKALLAAHLDWILLAFMQALAAQIHTLRPLGQEALLTGLLVAGGWLNAVPYLFRGVGVDAFVFAGGVRQRLASAIAGLSALLLTVAWGLILAQLLLSIEDSR